jgi:hypothetical protein
MEEENESETSVTHYQATRRHFPEDDNHHFLSSLISFLHVSVPSLRESFQLSQHLWQ